MSSADEVSRESPSSPSGSPWLKGPRRNTDAPAKQDVGPSSSVRGWSIVLGAGILAGAAGFGIGEAAPKLTPPDLLNLPPEIRASSSQKPLEIERRMGIARDRAATLAYGGLGMVLGLALGAAGGLVRRSSTAAIAAGLTGLILGAAAGAGTTRAILPYYHTTRGSATDENKTNDLELALMTHAAIWSAVGAAAGFALGLGLGGGGRIARATLGGILGAGLAAVIYEFAGAIIFPTDQTFRPMAFAAAPRLLANLAVAICAGVGAFGVADYLTIGRKSTATGSPI
jgi:hypothetical protein